MALEIGYLLNERYRITQVLGKGGMGSVYKAVDESLSVDVAVKENLIDDEEASRQFRREATILASLRHPNLPRVTDHFVIPGQGQYLVMDFVEGEDLKQRLERLGALEEKEVTLIGIAICEALSYLQSLDQPVVHRDIKPGNIKITSKGQVFLVDFGLVKVIEGSGETTSGARGLTPGYSPPEQYGSARTDGRSDIYSLGATLYTILTGSAPAEGLAIIMEQAKLVKINEHNPMINPKLAAAIEKAINVKPEDRFQTAAEFKQALLEASDTVSRQVAQGTIKLEPAPPQATDATIRSDSLDGLTPATKGKGKFKFAPWMLAGVVILCLAAAAAGVFLVGPRLFSNFFPGLAASESTATLAIATETQPVVEAAATATEETVAPAATDTIEPVQRPTLMGGSAQIAFASMRDGLPQIYLMNLETKKVTKITDIRGGACQPSWSPDGKRIVFTSPCNNNKEMYDNSGLFIMDADGSNLLDLNSPIEGDYDPDWSPDGKKIVFTSLRDGNRHIYVLDLENREAKGLSGKNAHEFQPNWSPDGALIAFTTVLSGPKEVWTMTINGGDHRVFSRVQKGDSQDPLWSPDMKSIIFIHYAGSDNRAVMKTARWLDGSVERGFNEVPVIDISATTREPDYSTDGYWLVFVSSEEPGNLDIFLMRANGADLQRLTMDPAADFDPAWRPGIPIE